MIDYLVLILAGVAVAAITIYYIFNWFRGRRTSNVTADTDNIYTAVTTNNQVEHSTQPQPSFKVVHNVEAEQCARAEVAAREELTRLREQRQQVTTSLRDTIYQMMSNRSYLTAIIYLGSLRVQLERVQAPSPMEAQRIQKLITELEIHTNNTIQLEEETRSRCQTLLNESNVVTGVNFQTYRDHHLPEAREYIRRLEAQNTQNQSYLPELNNQAQHLLPESLDIIKEEAIRAKVIYLEHTHRSSQLTAEFQRSMVA